MRRLPSLALCLVAVFIGQSTAHFLLNYPPTVGFKDDAEDTPPCGSFSVDFSTDNVTDFHVGGDSLALTSIHPQATWLFRATLDQTASGNWTDLLPPIVQTGLNEYCELDVKVPASWAGSKGVLQIVQDAPDGILYQCAAVKFVPGSTTPPSVCKNATGVSAAYTSDASLSNLPASATASSATSSTSSTSTTKPSDATKIHSYDGLSLLMWLVTIASATVMMTLF